MANGTPIDNHVSWNQRDWTILAGFGAFVIVLLVLADYAPELAKYTLIGMFVGVILFHAGAFEQLAAQFHSAYKGTAQ